MKRLKDKYGRGSAAANGAGFVDLAPGDTFDGLERQLRARIAEVYVNDSLGISASIASNRNANELAKHVDITKDARPERTPRGGTAPFLDLTSFVADSIAYYVGDCNRTRPEFVNRSEPFSIERAAVLLTEFITKTTPHTVEWPNVYASRQ